MKFIQKSLLVFVIALIAFASFSSLRVVEATSSTSYTYALDDEQRFVRTQDAYLPGQTITSLGLNKPTDVAIDHLNNIVIVDSGNARIVIFNPRTGSSSEIRNPQMLGPTGVFVIQQSSVFLAQGDIFVADPAVGKVFHFAYDGTLKNTFGKPTAPLYETLQFQPEKIAVDQVGTMYIVSKGSSDGIVQLSSQGEFQNFFASNRVQLTLMEQFQQFIYTDEQLTNLGLNLTPPIFTSIFIDHTGIVYSSSSGRRVDNIKKHNTQGNNMLVDIFVASTRLSDITVDRNGIIYSADQNGFIDVYTNDGEFIYTFGSISDVDVAGFFKTLSGLVVDIDGKIWTVDSGKSYLQSFVPTEYAQTIYQAIINYNETRYEQSIELWKNVLRLNQLSILAHNGLAKNYLQTEQYQLAAYHFEIAGNRTLYSEAFWEIRNLWLQDNLLGIIGFGFLFSIAFLVLKAVEKKSKFLEPVRIGLAKIGNVRVISDVLFVRQVHKKPSDTFYALRKGKSGSYLGAFILLLITFFSYLFYIAGKGFIFQTQSLRNLDLGSIVLGFVLLVGLFVLCSYLITSIQDGEGTFGEIFKGFSYSTYPFILGTVFSTLASYVATTNELFLLNFLFFAGLIGTVLMIFLSISEIQNYSFGQTVKSILFTLFFIIIILLVISFVQMTIGQLFSFFEEIIKEAIRNAIG
jgi:tetratricopeptide (TPR) repeat protein